MSGPSNRCGFVLTKEDTPHDHLNESQLRFGPFLDTCCWRETWNDGDRCIWHAKSENKPVSKLVESRSDHPERLDGVYLRGLKIDDRLSFEDCTVHYSTFDGSRLGKSSWRGVIGYYTSFKGCELSECVLSESIFFSADFSESNMQIIVARGASFTECDFARAIIGGDFQDSDIEQCDWSKSEKGSCDFTGARVIEVDFSESLLPGIRFILSDGSHNDFSECDIVDGTFSYSNMNNCNFDSASITGCVAVSSGLEECDFTGASIAKSNFLASDLYGCLLQNVQVDRATSFGDHYLRSERPPRTIHGIRELKSSWDKGILQRGSEDDDRLLEKRIWVLQSLQDLSKRNSLPDQARRFYIERKDAQREFASVLGHWGDWSTSTGSKVIMEYGENPMRIISWSVVAIFGFSALYTVTGGVEGAQLDPIVFNVGGETITIANTLLIEYFKSLYFSSMTFSSLGYGDLQPATWTVRVFATLESLIGVILTALLVFVLGRRTTW